MMAQDVASLLLDWFETHRRDLPWREEKPRNPYHVWISEIMLQQTRTEAVKGYFAAWMHRFPTVEKLAGADEAEVLHAWQGLGYYSRARNIHKAAGEIAAAYGGRFPREEKEIRSLPGIGDYTAGAILSLAYGEKVPAVDGNVLRVYARLYDVEVDITRTKGKKEIRALVEKTLPERAGDFNEALMDLGSEICIPRRPRCSECPLASLCEAFRKGKTESLPVRAPKKKQKEYNAFCAVWIRDGKVLLHKREKTGMLASMWEFPMVLSEAEADISAGRKELEQMLDGKAEELVWSYTHIFTHRIWHMKAYLFEAGQVPEGEYRWFSPEEYQRIPLAGPHAKLAALTEKYV